MTIIKRTMQENISVQRFFPLSSRSHKRSSLVPMVHVQTQKEKERIYIGDVKRTQNLTESAWKLSMSVWCVIFQGSESFHADCAYRYLG